MDDNIIPLFDKKSDQQNAHILSAMSKSEKALAQLIAANFTILSIHLESRNPIINIQNHSRCDTLKGARKTVMNTSEGRFTVMTVPLHGCQVEWVVRE